VRHIRLTLRQIEELKRLNRKGLEQKAREYRVPVELVKEVARLGRLPVVWFCAGGIATPADASLVMQFGVDGIFVGSGIFKSSDPPRMARAIVEATRYYDDPEVVLRASWNLPTPMKGTDLRTLRPEELLHTRGI
ncbi:MAG: pyridoxal 5'-phosphate synthase lyase subunit PdxS, partial [Candidatus Hadarchaeales archaeon]